MLSCAGYSHSLMRGLLRRTAFYTGELPAVYCRIAAIMDGAMLAITRPCALALVGMPGAGKTLCAEYLHQCGYPGFRFGQIVVDEVARRGLPQTQDSERIVREDLRAQEGMGAVAGWPLPVLQELLQDNPVIVIDGLYSFENIVCYSANWVRPCW